jgi:phosphoglycolate phosphatase-like HAD superfamily hydrolase
VLFDIDGTMLMTQRAGTQAMQEAARKLFSPSFTFDGVEIAGRLDPLIWRDVARRNGVDDHDAHHDRFRAEYGRILARNLRDNPTTTVLPGVPALIESLRRQAGVTLGVLTGNYPETGRLKIDSAGIDPDVFTVNAWGSDGTQRRDLPPVAMRIYRESGRELDPRQVVIIGDTPHDIDCARHNGCRALGVATGSFTVEQLRACGADMAVPDLTATTALVEWMLAAMTRVGAR